MLGFLAVGRGEAHGQVLYGSSEAGRAVAFIVGDHKERAVSGHALPDIDLGKILALIRDGRLARGIQYIHRRVAPAVTFRRGYMGLGVRARAAVQGVGLDERAFKGGDEVL